MTYHDESKNPGLGHTVFDALSRTRGDWLPFLRPVTYHIEEASGYKMNELLRIRIGLLLPSDGRTNDPHLDFPFPHYTACYYVNDTEGPTVIYDQKSDGTQAWQDAKAAASSNDFTIACSSHPRKNNLVIFDGMRYHASSYPTKTKRMVMTVNYR